MKYKENYPNLLFHGKQGKFIGLNMGKTLVSRTKPGPSFQH